jgi:hypothetical protein
MEGPRGPIGKKGYNGSRGLPGIQGPPGENGYTSRAANFSQCQYKVENMKTARDKTASVEVNVRESKVNFTFSKYFLKNVIFNL